MNQHEHASFLEDLSKVSVEKGPLPINEILQNSLYYPASEFDGGVVKFFGNEIQSFVYCDYATGERALLAEMDNFLGYRILAHRPLKEQELIPNGWTQQLPPEFNMRNYYKYQDFFKKPFAHWIVYERLENYTPDHGPDRFSLLYVGGEGVATYQALYWSNRKTCKTLAIIQPGVGFGNNWTDFRRQDGPLGWVVLNNRYGKPETILYGGRGFGYRDLDWNGYVYQDTIHCYYGYHPGESKFNRGEVTVWKK